MWLLDKGRFPATSDSSPQKGPLHLTPAMLERPRRTLAARAIHDVELDAALRAAGFTDVTARRFPLAALPLSVWGHVFEGRR